MKVIIVSKVLHERVEAVSFFSHKLEVVEGGQDDMVTTLDQADGSQQLQHQGLGAQRVVHQAQGDAVDGLSVLNHHVEAVLEQNSVYRDKIKFTRTMRLLRTCEYMLTLSL